MIRGGRSLVSAAPAFSNDCKKLLVCTGSSVSIFSTSTALQISSLEGHTALVTTVFVVPSTSKALSYCWTASLDGTIRYWDYSVPELLKTINVRLPIYSMVIPILLQPGGGVAMKHDVFAYISVENINAPKDKPKPLLGQIRKCNLTRSRVVGGITLAETPAPVFITVSPSGKFLGIRNKRRLYIWNVPDEDSDRFALKKIILHHTKTFSTLAFHPRKRIVAAGDVTGRVLIWREFGQRTFLDGERMLDGQLMNSKEERAGVRGDDDANSCSTWHWHSEEVLVLHFSSDGAYLYSGGREGVLVFLQLETGNKKFLPRIGSPLLYFKDSPDPSLSSVSCAANQIHILNMPSLKISKSISGIKLPFSLPEACGGFCGGFAFGQDAGIVALRTENFCIQLYNLLDDREFREVQVCERNHQPTHDIMVAVALVVISPDGSIMSTVEVKLPEKGIGGLISLKFWDLGSLNGECSLSTIVYEPHREAGITCIAFHPTRRMAISSSNGGDFKIWICERGSESEDKVLSSSGWTCHAVGSYKKKPLTAASFSADGSVLAVAADTVITLWDPDKNVLLAVIGETVTTIVSLSFVGEYLVSTSQDARPQLSVWTLSKLAMRWSYKLRAEAVASAPDGSSFAVLSVLPKASASLNSNEDVFQGRDGLILLFNVKNPVPVASWSVRKASGGQIAYLKGNVASLSDDGNSTAHSLVYINGDHEYVIFYPNSTESQERSVMHQESPNDLQERAGQSGYASIYGELPVVEQKGNQASAAPFVPSDRPSETIFSGSSHSLPPLMTLCSAFLESFLEKRTTFVE